MITRTATTPMSWGTQVRGDGTACWPHCKGSRRGQLLGVLKRPLGVANECAAGEEVTIRTDGHVLALIDGEPVSVMLRGGRVV